MCLFAPRPNDFSRTQAVVDALSQGAAKERHAVQSHLQLHTM